MPQLADLIRQADKPAGCKEAEDYRAVALEALEGWCKEKEDRILNLKRLLPGLEWAQKEDVRSTIQGLERDFMEFFKGRKI